MREGQLMLLLLLLLSLIGLHSHTHTLKKGPLFFQSLIHSVSKDANEILLLLLLRLLLLLLLLAAAAAACVHLVVEEKGNKIETCINVCVCAGCMGGVQAWWWW